MKIANDFIQLALRPVASPNAARIRMMQFESSCDGWVNRTTLSAKMHRRCMDEIPGKLKSTLALEAFRIITLRVSIAMTNSRGKSDPLP